MNIVQYLHGLVSRSMGISDEDVSADLLKQYYALSTARLIELDNTFDSNNPKNHTLTALWGIQALPLAKRLARSFHMDEGRTITLLKSITPPMMVEVSNLAGGQDLIHFLVQNFESGRTHLPAWSPQFIQSSLSQKIEHLNQHLHNTSSNPHQSANDDHHDEHPSVVSLQKPLQQEMSNPDAKMISQDLHPSVSGDALGHDTPIIDITPTSSPIPDATFNKAQEAEANHPDTGHATPGGLNGHQPIKPKITRPNPLLMGLGAGLIALLIGMTAWYLSQKKSNQAPVLASDPNVATPSIEALNPPRLSLTSGENGVLYACQAEVGNAQLQEQLLGILQKNFGQIGCIMDIDDNFGTSLTGLERLESIMTMVKAEPFTSIEIIGSHIYVNTPKTDILPRIVNDIALLAPQFQVAAAPTLDKPSVINQSFERAINALNKLDNPPNDYDLSRAASLAIIDFNGTTNLPADAANVLKLLAQKLKENPNARFIIATHTSGGAGTDRMANLTLSQSQAEAVKAFLVQQGVNESQLTPKGVGDNFPVSDNMTELGRFKNGRTEFLVFDEATMSALNVDMTLLVPAPNTAMPAQQVQNTPIQNIPTPSMPMPTNMPVQGMPNGNYTPEPAYNAQPQPTPVESYPAQALTQSQGYIGTGAPPVVSAAPPSTTLPAELIEMSNVTINSEVGERIQRSDQ